MRSLRESLINGIRRRRLIKYGNKILSSFFNGNVALFFNYIARNMGH